MKPGLVIKKVTTDNGIFELRLLSNNDVGNIKALNKDMLDENEFVYSVKEKTMGNEKGWLRKAVLTITRNEAVYIIATNGKKAAGKVRIEKQTGKKSHTADIDIRIRKEYRGLGLGKTMIGEAIRLANKHLNIKMIIPDTYGNNERAIGIYKDFGFKEYGNLPKATKIDNEFVNKVFMYKEL